jgi:hypothetical protein
MSADDPSSSATDSRETSVRETARSRRLVLAAGFLASLLTWLGSEFVVRSIPTEKDGAIVNGERQGIVTAESADRSDVKRATIVYGIQGAVLAMALGIAGGVTRRSRSSAIMGGLIGLVIGAVGGAGVSSILFPWFFRNLDPISGDLLLPLLTHFAIWSTLGVAAGVSYASALAGGARGMLLAVLGGIAGAVCGALVYEISGAIVFSGAKTDQPYASETPARLLAHAATGLAISLGVWIARNRGVFSSASLTSAVVLLGLAGCGGSPESGKLAVEPPEVQARREATIKDMMKQGAYGDQYKNKVPK